MTRKSTITKKKNKVLKGTPAPAAREKVLQRKNFYQSITKILRTAQSKAYSAINFTMVQAYWNIGRMIVEEEQKGKGRADYGVE